MTSFWSWPGLRFPEQFTVAVAAYQAGKLETLRELVDQAIEENWSFREFVARKSNRGSQ